MALGGSTEALLLSVAFREPSAPGVQEIVDELVQRLEAGEADEFADAIQALVASRLEWDMT